jgi:hypothetical protein
MTSSSDCRSTPNKDYVFGLYDPDGEGLSFYKTESERNDSARKTIKGYLDGNKWVGEVVNVFAFVVTHQARQTNIIYPVGELDEDGYDEVGNYFHEADSYNCDYELKPIQENQPTEDQL